jgi:hypothetical protein
MRILSTGDFSKHPCDVTIHRFHHGYETSSHTIVVPDPDLADVSHAKLFADVVPGIQLTRNVLFLILKIYLEGELCSVPLTWCHIYHHPITAPTYYVVHRPELSRQGGSDIDRYADMSITWYNLVRVIHYSDWRILCVVEDTIDDQFSFRWND